MDYAVSITFIYTGKPKKLYDLLYCDIHFIVVAWKLTQNISNICLYRKGEENLEIR